MRARIYKPAKTATSSGMAKSKQWILEFAESSSKTIDPLMGWTSASDTQHQVKLKFDSKEKAMKYADEKGIEYIIVQPKDRKLNIRQNGYGENFSHDRKTPWTH